MEKVPNTEQLEQELRFNVESAKKAALFADEYREKEKQFNTIREMRKTGTLPKGLEEKYKVLQLELIAGRVDVNNLYEYRKVLEFAEFSSEQVSNILNHENAHANVADQTQSQKFKGYRILFTKDNNGELLVQPFAKLSTDYSFSKEQIAKDRISVIEAPTHYGDRLSPDDKEKIKALQKDLWKNTSTEISLEAHQEIPEDLGIEVKLDKPSTVSKSKNIGLLNSFANFFRNVFKTK